MKKLIIYCFAFTMLFTLCACGKKESPPAMPTVYDYSASKSQPSSSPSVGKSHTGLGQEPAIDEPSQTDAPSLSETTDNSQSDNYAPPDIERSFNEYMEARKAPLDKVTELAPLASGDNWRSVQSELWTATYGDFMLATAIIDEHGEEMYKESFGVLPDERFSFSQEGGRYTIERENKGGSFKYETEYIKKDNHLIAQNYSEGILGALSEYCSTDYGYAAQYFTHMADGSTQHCIITISGNDIIVGFEYSSGKPEFLESSVAFSVPKAMSVWYALENNNLSMSVR